MMPKQFDYKKLNFKDRLHIRIEKKMLKEFSMLSLLAIDVGIMAGFGAVLFRYLIFFMSNLFLQHSLSLSSNPYQLFTSGLGLVIIFMPMIGGLLVGLLIYFFAPEAKGHGVPEVLEAMVVKSGKIRVRAGLIKALASAITIGSGGSSGREGPIIQIGAASGSFLAQVLGLSTASRKTLLACGATAGLAATFNAPIGGVIFSIEIILLEFKARSFIPLVISSVMGTIVSHAFLGDNVAFPIKNLVYSANPLGELPLFLLLGVVCGVTGLIFKGALKKTEYGFEKMKIPAYTKPMIGGLLVGIMGFLSFRFIGQYFIFGVDYGVIMTILNSNSFEGVTMNLFFVLIAILALKILATAFTLGSGASGGVFAPMLFMGAAVGGAFGLAMQYIFPSLTTPFGIYAIVGMGAVFAGGARATLTSTVILFELTSNYTIILPLMFSSVISSFIVNVMSDETIYTERIKKLGLRYSYDREINILETIPVKNVMVEDVTTVTKDMTMREVSHLIIETGYQGFPCIDDDGKLCGIVTHKDVRRALKEDKLDAITVKEAMNVGNIISCHPNDTLEKAMEIVTYYGYGRLPVVDPDDSSKLVGILTREDILKVHKDKLMEEVDEWIRPERKRRRWI